MDANDPNGHFLGDQWRLLKWINYIKVAWRPEVVVGTLRRRDSTLAVD